MRRKYQLLVGAVTATARVIRAVQAVFAVGVPMVMAGGVELSAIVALAVFVQPFAAVTVTV
ncbi:MAG: hypothetical protein IPL33_18865 [Sphingobacteriales bacterium]|nr:hypothetical protein [Sphingobacteriales bacterium]